MMIPFYDVDKHTTRHIRHDQIVELIDVSGESQPVNAKTLVRLSSGVYFYTPRQAEDIKVEINTAALVPGAPAARKGTRSKP